MHDEVHNEVNTCTSKSHKVNKILRRTTFSWTCFEEGRLLCTRKPNFSSPAVKSMIWNLFVFVNTCLSQSKLLYVEICFVLVSSWVISSSVELGFWVISPFWKLHAFYIHANCFHSTVEYLFLFPFVVQLDLYNQIKLKNG